MRGMHGRSARPPCATTASANVERRAPYASATATSAPCSTSEIVWMQVARQRSPPSAPAAQVRITGIECRLNLREILFVERRFEFVRQPFLVLSALQGLLSLAGASCAGYPNVSRNYAPARDDPFQSAIGIALLQPENEIRFHRRAFG